MPFLSSTEIGASSFSTMPFFKTRFSSKSKSGMGRSTSRASKHDGMTTSAYDHNLPEPMYPRLNVAMNHNTTAYNRPVSQQSNPWGPPPYSPAAEPNLPPFSPEAIHPDPATTGSPALYSDDSEYAFLAKFDTVFIVDDSGSMSGGLWKEAEEAIASITPICTQYDHDGIDLYFLNHWNNAQRCGGYTNVTSPAAVQNIFRSVQPYGMTPVGQRLRQILFPYLRRVERMAANTDDYGQTQNPDLVVRPMNIIVITDGVFSDDAETVILDTARTLDRCQMTPWQVGIQFFQIGMDREARKYLEQLDDELGKAVKSDHVRDIVDTVPWKGQTGHTLSGDGIMKVVLGAVNKRLDRQKGHAA